MLDDSDGGHTRFYDEAGENRVVKGEGTKFSARPYTHPVDGQDNPERDWGHTTGVIPWVRAGGGLGVLLGLELRRTDYGFRKHPYGDQHKLRVAYSTELNDFGGHYAYESLRTDNRARFGVDASISDLSIIRFHGFGNETSSAQPDDFYDVEQREYTFEPAYRFDTSGFRSLHRSGRQVRDDAVRGPTDAAAAGEPLRHRRLRAGGRASRVRPGPARPPGCRHQGRVPGSGRLRLPEGVGASRRRSARSHGGGGRATRRRRSRLRAHARATGGRPAGVGPVPLPRVRVRGGPVHHPRPAPPAVRGRRSAYGNAELRLTLVDRGDAFLSRIGVFGLADGGRVWLAGESSDTWHHGVGGGVFVSVMKPDNVCELLAVAQSEGRTRVYLLGGFMF